MPLNSVDPLDLAQRLIGRPAVTPTDAGALGVLEEALRPLGFRCRRLQFEGDGAAPVDNLYARIGDRAPNFCFAGHTDVVPPGDEAAWSAPPFAAEVRGGALWGRGAADMKSAIAAFVGAAAAHLRAGPLAGSISLLITGDEEGVAINGTRKALAQLAAEGETINHCLVGEPTNPDALGDMIKIGRRGSMNCILKVAGQQGHVAYPQQALNPIPVLIRIPDRLLTEPLDDGYEGFQPSNLEATTVDVGNGVENVIPPVAEARFNVRFNPNWTGAALEAHLRDLIARAGEGSGADVDLRCRLSGEAYLTSQGPYTDLLQEAVEAVTGRRPDLSTSGGTSDARFIRAYAPVAEFGLIGRTMHKIDEHVAVSDIETLTAIYTDILRRYFDADWRAA